MLDFINKLISTNDEKRKHIQELAGEMPILEELSSNPSESDKIADASCLDRRVIRQLTQFGQSVYCDK